MNIAKPDETEEMYQKNLALLPPWLKDAVSNIQEEEYRGKIEVTYNTEGYPVCRYRRDGSCFHITSEHPVEEAKAWSQVINLQDSAEIFLYGCGFGYALFELFAQKPPQALVIVYEWDVCLFSAMLRYFDLLPLVQTQKIVFFIGDPSCIKAPLIEYLATEIYDVTTFPTVVFTLSAARSFKKEYLEIHRRVFEQLSFVMSTVGNSHQDDMTGLRNLLANTKEFLINPFLSSIKDKYVGKAAIIVSNGPSLDKSMPLLKQIQGRCLMLCAESAIVPLTKNGIRPDIVCVLERTKENYFYHFENRNHSPDIALCALGMADPRIFSSFKGEKIPVFRKGESLNRWFNRHLGDGSELDAGASVAHLALSAAVHLGADPIIFIGQDLSYGQDGASHSKDAVAMQKEGKRIRDTLHSLPTVYVEGNNGEMLPSNQIWVNFLFIMENIISLHPEHLFYNATEGGAKIKGTKRAKLSELIEQYCAEPLPYRVADLIAKEREKVSVAERAARLDNMITDIGHYARFFRELSREANIRKLECERMMVLCLGKDEDKFQDILDETYQNNIASFYRCREDGLCDFFTQRLLCAYFYLFAQLGVIDTQQKRAQIFELHSLFFRDLRAVGQSLAVTLEEAAQSQSAIREELNGKAEKKYSSTKKLSLCIIAKDEDPFLADCIKNMEGTVDEIIVADIGSGSRSSELAKHTGATVYQLTWEEDFSEIKNFCMDHATGDWVLFLQADETIPREQHRDLKILMLNPAAEGYLIEVDDGCEKREEDCPAQSLRLIRNRMNYRFHYRSFEYIPDEELCSILNGSIKITRGVEKASRWQTEERIQLLQMDLKERPQDGYVRYLQGIELFNQGKYKESAASLELARHALCGGYLYASHLYKCLAACFLALSRYKTAEELLSEGIFLFPYNTDLMVLQAELYRQLGRDAEAIKVLEECLMVRNASNVCVPEPQTDISAIEKKREEIRAVLEGMPVKV